MSRLSTERIAEIRERIRRATAATSDGWDMESVRFGSWKVTAPSADNPAYRRRVADSMVEPDADLIANAPTDLADLLDERRLLLAVVREALAYVHPDDTTCGDPACEYCAFVRAVRAYRAATTGDES